MCYNTWKALQVILFFQSRKHAGEWSTVLPPSTHTGNILHQSKWRHIFKKKNPAPLNTLSNCKSTTILYCPHCYLLVQSTTCLTSSLRHWNVKQISCIFLTHMYDIYRHHIVPQMYNLQLWHLVSKPWITLVPVLLLIFHILPHVWAAKPDMEFLWSY